MATTLLTLCGSLRADSNNGRLLRVAAALLPEGVGVDHYEGLAGLPAFDPALDLAPGPAVEDLRRRVKAAAGILIATPEYAHGMPGALKNALDWMVGSGELMAKPVAILVAGATDGEHTRRELVEVLRTMSAKVPPDLTLGIAGIRSRWGLDGSLDPLLTTWLKGMMEGLVEEMKKSA